jgi:long-chain acyl-CoA synthetase
MVNLVDWNYYNTQNNYLKNNNFRSMKTIVKLFDTIVTEHPSNVAFWEKYTDKYEPTTYHEMQDRARALSACLKSYGIEKGDRVAMLSQARRDWVVSEMGIFNLGAINVPLSTKLETADIIFRLNHSSSKIIIISEIHYPKISNVLDQLPSLEKVILLDAKETYVEKEIFIDAALLHGREILRTYQRYVTTEIEKVQDEDDALISYTSGTSADPKGVILTHKNLWINSLQCAEFFALTEETVSLLILPLDHSFAHTGLMYTILRKAAALASVQTGKSPAEALRNLPINIKETRPQLLISVPALTKNFKKNIEAGIKKKGKVAEMLFNAGQYFGQHYHGMGHNKGKGFRKLSYYPYKLIDTMVFLKIRENFGGRLDYFVGGGAYLDIDLQKFFFAIGIPIYQGYGLTEASPVISANTPQSYKIGSSGKVINYLEVKICDDDGNTLPLGQKGEIVVRGENVMKGYYLNPVTTAETIKKGWLHTGDMGYLDGDNFLYVLGRFKSLLISNDGEKYSPEGIESALTEGSKLIDQIMLYNNQCNYTTAVIYPKKEQLKKWMSTHEKKAQKHDGKHSIEELVIKEIEQEIMEYKLGGKQHGQFPERWLPTSFVIIPEPFTEENKMINSTLKMVRNKIVEYYKERIDSLYTADGKDICNAKNIEAVKFLAQ